MSTSRETPCILALNCQTLRSSGDVTDSSDGGLNPISEMFTLAVLRPQNKVPCIDTPPPTTIQIFPFCLVISAELHFSGLTGTASHPDMQIFRIIGFFLEIGYIGSLVGGKNLQTAVLGCIFIYV